MSFEAKYAKNAQFSVNTVKVRSLCVRVCVCVSTNRNPDPLPSGSVSVKQTNTDGAVSEVRNG